MIKKLVCGGILAVTVFGGLAGCTSLRVTSDVNRAVVGSVQCRNEHLDGAEPSADLIELAGETLAKAVARKGVRTRDDAHLPIGRQSTCRPTHASSSQDPPVQPTLPGIIGRPASGPFRSTSLSSSS